MRKFVTKFFIFAFLVLGIIFLVNTTGETRINRHAEFHLVPVSRIIILGHSHPAYAFNDALIDHASNMAYPAEAYFYTAIKLRKILELNKDIKIALVDFSVRGITLEMNDWIWNEYYASKFHALYSPFMHYKEKIFIMGKTKFKYPGLYINAFYNNLHDFVEPEPDYSTKIGGYYHSSSVLSHADTIQRQAATVADANNISWDNIRYLDTILNMLEQKGIKAFLIRSPTHPCSVHENSENIFKNLLHHRFAYVEMLDFSKFPLLENELSDCNHLNQQGAKIFSTWFNGLVKDGLFYKQDKQAYIDERLTLGHSSTN